MSNDIGTGFDNVPSVVKPLNRTLSIKPTRDFGDGERRRSVPLLARSSHLSRANAWCQGPYRRHGAYCDVNVAGRDVTSTIP